MRRQTLPVRRGNLFPTELPLIAVVYGSLVLRLRKADLFDDRPPSKAVNPAGTSGAWLPPNDYI
jgi:hypothetical protein